MISELQDKIAEYITRGVDITSWRDIREKYEMYSYLAFLCFAAIGLNPDCRAQNVGDVIIEHNLEEENIIQFAMSFYGAENFLDEILILARKSKEIDMNGIYQSYLAREYIIVDNTVVFEGGKNKRDILGAYYTQEDFAREITQKAMEEFFAKDPGEGQRIKIADYSCGGGAFLTAAYRICNEKNTPVQIYGYDVDPIAVLITRFRLYHEIGAKKEDINIFLGNPLLRQGRTEDPFSVFRLAVAGRFYCSGMGISVEENMDIVLGNPPWEKIRFEEKKFLHHYASEGEIGTKLQRENYLKMISCDNRGYYESLSGDYEAAKRRIRKDPFFAGTACGELNTYALFAELCLNALREGGTAGIIIKSSLVKMPVYRTFLDKITSQKMLLELYLFVNRKKIFNIDSREEFSVVYFKKGNQKDLKLVLNLDTYKYFSREKKIEVSYKLLNILNPDTGMLPNIKSNEELEFLTTMYRSKKTFDEVYSACKFGRLVHLTNHAGSIRRQAGEGYVPVYEGKFIEIYTGKYATYGGMEESDKYKNKAAARLIQDIEGTEYPQARFYIKKDVWESLSKRFDGTYVVAWRSLTSATNRRTMLATMLPLVPACQSIQLLQSGRKEMLHILSLFNSIIFDYIVRLKMVGLDLTQTIIRQIPVPEEEAFYEELDFMGKTASVETHINSRLKQLYFSDFRLKDLFEGIETYALDSGTSRKQIIAEIDQLTAFLYSINEESLKKIALTFKKYYSEEEVEMFF